MEEPNRTYNGYTVNPCRRLRQHNQIIKGGAKYTSRFGNKTWNYIVLISGFANKIDALKYEWKIKHPDGKRIRSVKYNNPIGRIIGLNQVLFNHYIGYKLTIYVLSKYAGFLEVDNNRYDIVEVENIDIREIQMN